MKSAPKAVVLNRAVCLQGHLAVLGDTMVATAEGGECNWDLVGRGQECW